MSSLHGAGAEAGDQVALDEHEQDGQRQGHEDGGRHHEAPVDVHALEEVHDADGQRHLGDRVDEDPRDQVVVPRHDEREDRGGDDAGPRQRQHDEAEDLPAARAVDEPGLLDLDRDRLEERPHQPHAERQRDGDVAEHEARAAGRPGRAAR